MTDTVIKNFGNKLRIRVCGICIQNNSILLLKHKSINASGYFLSPPGGGLEYGESMHACLKREFKEETNLEIQVLDHLFVNEFLSPPLHAIEHFFKIRILNGNLKLGKDPELDDEEQIMETVDFYSLQQIRDLPKDTVHPFFQEITSLDELLKLENQIK